MNLPHKFKEQAAAKTSDYSAPPFKIRGKDLDENFNMVKPSTHVGEGKKKAYRISEDREKGWEMIFEWWPPPEEGTYVLGSINGTMQWIETQDCAEEA